MLSNCCVGSKIIRKKQFFGPLSACWSNISALDDFGAYNACEICDLLGCFVFHEWNRFCGVMQASQIEGVLEANPVCHIHGTTN